jgi:hypothetical protein
MYVLTCLRLVYGNDVRLENSLLLRNGRRTFLVLLLLLEMAVGGMVLVLQLMLVRELGRMLVLVLLLLNVGRFGSKGNGFRDDVLAFLLLRLWRKPRRGRIGSQRVRQHHRRGRVGRRLVRGGRRASDVRHQVAVWKRRRAGDGVSGLVLGERPLHCTALHCTALHSARSCFSRLCL